MPKKKSQKAALPKLDEPALHEAALNYLDRYDASEMQLRRVLARRIFKYAEDAQEKEDATRTAEAVIERLLELRLIGDEAFALRFARSSRARGTSSALIRKKLLTRGIVGEQAEAALHALADEEEEAALRQADSRDGESDNSAYDFGAEPPKGDRGAALVYARKRRLHKKYDLNDRISQSKALASLARQGFSFGDARFALETLQEEERAADEEAANKL